MKRKWGEELKQQVRFYIDLCLERAQEFPTNFSVRFKSRAFQAFELFVYSPFTMTLLHLGICKFR